MDVNGAIPHYLNLTRSLGICKVWRPQQLDIDDCFFAILPFWARSMQIERLRVSENAECAELAEGKPTERKWM